MAPVALPRPVPSLAQEMRVMEACGSTNSLYIPHFKVLFDTKVGPLIDT